MELQVKSYGYFYGLQKGEKDIIVFRHQMKKKINSDSYYDKRYESYTVWPGSSDPFYIVRYFIKRVTTSWTHTLLNYDDDEI